MRTIRRTATTAVVTGALLAASAGTAAAHQCMIADRSQQAEQKLAASPMWLSEDMATEEAYDFTFQVVLGVEASPEMLEEAVALHLEQDLQRWASFFEGHTLLNNPKTGSPTPAADKHAGDGRGVDHWSTTELGLAMIAIAQQVLDAHSA